MLQRRPVITAFLVAVTIVAFQVDGMPVGGKSKEINYDFKSLDLPKPTHSEVLEQQRALSAMTIESLRNTLYLNDNVRILDTLASFLVGLSRQPPNGALDSRLASYFLDCLEEFAPEFVIAVKIVSRIIEADSLLWAANKPADYEDLFRHAAGFYYDRRECEQLSKSFSVIKNLIHEAMGGNVAAAKKIMNYLSAQYKDYRNLTSINRGNILQSVLIRIDWYLKVGIKPMLEDA